MDRMIRRIFVFLVFITAFAVSAQEESSVMLMDFFNTDLQLQDGTYMYEDELYEGYTIPVGATIHTLSDGYAELELTDTTIIKIDELTSFSVDSVLGVEKADKNIFSLTVGKFRAVVASITDKETYQFNGYSAVCGVRGTDLGMFVAPTQKEDSCWILHGRASLTHKKTGKKIEINENNMANTFDDVFQPRKIPDDFRRNVIGKNLEFKKLKIDKVRTKDKPEPTIEPGDTEKDEDIDDEKEKEKKEEKEMKKEKDKKPIDTGIETEPGEETEAAEKEEEPEWVKALKEMIGMEIGSITIGDKTYAKAVIQPTFKIGDLKMALYLPIIYEKDMFDPDYWYKPKGNNEWSFGLDQSDPIDGVGDLLSDLFLKIKYVQWGEMRDTFWFKVGNVDDFTVGHGLIMNNYSNATDFPAIRRIGVNLCLDFEKYGFEFINNDISEIITAPRIIGARGYIRPFTPGFPLAFGLTGISDINTGAVLPEVGTVDMPSADEIGNPMFLNLGLDVDYPLVESDLLSVILFADVAGLIPWFLSDGTGIYSSISAGPAFEAMFPEDDPETFIRNYGFFTGLMGNVSVIDYIVDFRYFTGSFRPYFFNAAYDRTSSSTALEVANSIAFPDLDVLDNINMGIYGQAGYTWEKIFSIEMGYMFPITIDSLDGFQFMEGEDTFHAKFTLFKDVIPVVHLSGSISYDRIYFAKMLAGDDSPEGHDLDWFDEYTVLNGEIVYGVAPNLDLALLLTTAVRRDDTTGEVVYKSDGVTKEIDFTFSIETRISF
jgi:hypothetical protein